jgi:hypothetical protein
MRILGAVGASIAIIPSFTPAGVHVASEIWTGNQVDEDDENDVEGEGEMRNTGPVHFLTAVERPWYFECGLEPPMDGWTLCTGGDRAFEYRLEDGAWEFEVVHGHEDDVKVR